jgi:hypothetical protein
LLLKDDFPQIWVPSWENRDLRQMLWHRHRMVQARPRMMNQLQALALNEALRCKKKLWAFKTHQMLSLRSLAFILASAIRRARALSCAALDRSPDRNSGRKMATKMATKIATKVAVASISVSCEQVYTF